MLLKQSPSLLAGVWAEVGVGWGRVREGVGWLWWWVGGVVAKGGAR